MAKKSKIKFTKSHKILLYVIIGLGILLSFRFLISKGNLTILNPQGLIAHSERSIMFRAVGLMLLVAVPVLFSIFYVAWKYRAGNQEAEYKPNWDHNSEFEFIRWAAPGIIILILSIITWKSTHQLDPFKPIESGTPPLTIQVIALPWKWLFIYPQQNIATINFVEFPQNTPINFELTADAPMSSFWIPQLGGQMYAMIGMKTQLHLIADRAGEYAGSAAEINGTGFAGMRFVAKSVSQSDFAEWTRSIKQTSRALTQTEYDLLAKPSQNNPVTSYASAEKDLYNKVIAKFMAPATPTKDMPGMDMNSLMPMH